MTNPNDVIVKALDGLTVFNTKQEVATAILSAIDDAGLRVVDLDDEEPYVPDEYSRRMSMEDWRRLNRGVPPVEDK